MRARYTFNDIITCSPLLDACKRKAQKVAPTDIGILLWGETGTGKELFAQAIHSASSRANGPFVAVNCGAIPGTLAESIFFGYDPGTFTGASRQGNAGIFEQAHGGTLFLDEIGELPLELQCKLLRVLQEKEITRVGGKAPVRVDIRIVASTNKDLACLVKSGEFRADLYYRLRVVELHIPPLRSRREDIMLLLENFVRREVNRLEIEAVARDYLEAYPWPGNVRELQNFASAWLSLGDERITWNFVNDYFTPNTITPLDESPRQATVIWPHHEGLTGLLVSVERENIIRAVKEASTKRQAAEKLGISTTTLWRKLKQYGV